MDDELLSEEELKRPVWERCGCDQWGRCLVDCPTAHLKKWATPIGKRIGYRKPEPR